MVGECRGSGLRNDRTPRSHSVRRMSGQWTMEKSYKVGEYRGSGLWRSRTPRGHSGRRISGHWTMDKSYSTAHPIFSLVD